MILFPGMKEFFLQSIFIEKNNFNLDYMNKISQDIKITINSKSKESSELFKWQVFNANKY